jgi:hypothetical protein
MDPIIFFNPIIGPYIRSLLAWLVRVLCGLTKKASGGEGMPLAGLLRHQLLTACLPCFGPLEYTQKRSPTTTPPRHPLPAVRRSQPPKEYSMDPFLRMIRPGRQHPTGSLNRSMPQARSWCPFLPLPAAESLSNQPAKKIACKMHPICTIIDLFAYSSQQPTGTQK